MKTKIKSSNSFGKKLRALREAKGLSLRETGRLIGIHWVHLHYLETGKRHRPCFETVAKLASFFDIELFQLAKAL